MLHQRGWFWVGCVALIAVLLVLSHADAQVALSITTTDGKMLKIVARDQSRPDNAIVLYTSEFGESTRTNPKGVEVTSVKDPKHPHQYLVTRVWQCEENTDPSNASPSKNSHCGNTQIPANGVVLSASGNQKASLLDTLKPGQHFEIQEIWFKTETTGMDIVDPSPDTNPNAAQFPGYRGANQMVLYDRNFGNDSTGTNEFGFEVTVIDNVVVRQEGADSAIPKDKNGFVLSGHGRAKDWLLAHAPIGAKITADAASKEISSTIDASTYEFQLNQAIAGASNVLKPAALRYVNGNHRKIAELQASGNIKESLQLTMETIEYINRKLWENFPALPPDAIRAVWHRPTETTITEVDQTLDTLQNAGLNTVFLETSFHGYTIFPSQTYSCYGLPTENPKFSGVDLLQLWLQEAHKRHIKVHAWFEVFYSGTTAFEAPGPVLSKYPQWANVQFSALNKKEPTPSTVEVGAFFLDPANPEVRQFLQSVIEEIADRYPVDGIQLDYIRYPASLPPDQYSYQTTTWGYTPIAREKFKQEKGVDPAELNPAQKELWKAWIQFKIRQINEFVQQVAEPLHQKHAGVLISAAVFPKLEDSMLKKHQDWATWAKEGWVDFLAPMTLTTSPQVVEKDVKLMLDRTDNKVPVIAGIFAPFNQTTAENMLMQMKAAQESGAQGFSLFDSVHLTGRMLQALQASQTVTVASK